MKRVWQVAAKTTLVGTENTEPSTTSAPVASSRPFLETVDKKLNAFIITPS